MKRWTAITLATSAATLIASAADGAGTMQKSGMGMGMYNQEMQNRNMIECNMQYQGMMGMGMMGADAQKRTMADPEVQKMMTEHRQKMQEEQLRFREAMQKKMMSDPQYIQTMLKNMLQNQEAFKKTLNDNPDLKEQLRKAL